jgi:defect-in-organelle-trafficking protein DotC
MDAVDLDIWIEAQRPAVYEEIRSFKQPDDLSLVAPSDDDTDSFSGGNMRNAAVREAAFSLAAQTALAWRYDKLLKFTKSQEGTLDRIANYAPFVVDNHMLLPSVTETRDRYEITPDETKLRSVRIQYIIDEPARAVTEAPTWRDFIWREFYYPEQPDDVLFPRNETEVLIWESAADEGWDSGLEQAHMIWENNLNEMVRSIRGRITFKILEARDIVQMPVMTATEPTVTTSGNTVLNAGDTIYSVAVPVSFRPQDHWKALWMSVDEIINSPNFQSSEPDLFGDDPNMPDFGGVE